MRDDQDILSTFQLHDDWLQPNDNVTIGFAAEVAIVVLVFISGAEVLGVTFFDFGVGEAVTDAAVELV